MAASAPAFVAFVPAPAYAGPRPGFAFTSGDRGLGYYGNEHEQRKLAMLERRDPEGGAAQGDRLELQVCAISGAHVASVAAFAEDTGLVLKEAIARVLGTPVWQQKLIYGSEVLEDSQKIGPLTNGHVTLVKLLGFMPAPTFEGPRPGYAFKFGKQGRGYYLVPRDSEADAVLGGRLEVQICSTSGAHVASIVVSWADTGLVLKEAIARAEGTPVSQQELHCGFVVLEDSQKIGPLVNGYEVILVVKPLNCMAAPACGGPRPGCALKLGDQGLGYYVDEQEQRKLAAAPQREAAAGATRDGRLELQVCAFTGAHVVSVVAFAGDTGLVLKEAIARVEGTPMWQQKWLCGSRVLEDSQKIGPLARGGVVTLVRPNFMPAPNFEGSWPGYVFKLGEHGLGYYIDEQEQR